MGSREAGRHGGGWGVKPNQHRSYSVEDDDAIRAGWPDIRGIAASIDRTFFSIRARGRKLGLPNASGRVARPYTDADRQLVMERYPSEGAKPLARDLGRSRACIVSLADRLGVRHHRPWTTKEHARFLELHRAGVTAAAIGKELDRTEAAIAKRVQDSGLSVPLYDLDARLRELRAPQPIRDNFIEARWAKARLALGEHGWPPDLNPKEIKILDSLERNGPQTRRVLATSIGEPADRNHEKLLMTHGGRSSMARLLARGLVAKLNMNNGRRKQIRVYVLTRGAEAARGKFQTVESFNRPIVARWSKWANRSEPKEVRRAG